MLGDVETGGSVTSTNPVHLWSGENPPSGTFGTERRDGCRACGLL